MCPFTQQYPQPHGCVLAAAASVESAGAAIAMLAAAMKVAANRRMNFMLGRAVYLGRQKVVRETFRAIPI